MGKPSLAPPDGRFLLTRIANDELTGSLIPLSARFNPDGLREDNSAPSESSTPDEMCACTDAICIPGECVLEVVVGEACAEDWGNAQIFLNDLGSDAQPIGSVSAGESFRLCEPLQANAFDDQGNQTHTAVPFSFVVESEDGRLLSGSTGGETFECATSSPFVWTIEGC